jgi:hypothetical protein
MHKKMRFVRFGFLTLQKRAPTCGKIAIIKSAGKCVLYKQEMECALLFFLNKSIQQHLCDKFIYNPQEQGRIGWKVEKS